MRYILLSVCLLMTTASLHSQGVSEAQRQIRKDSLAVELKNELGIEKQKVDEVLAIISASNARMDSIVRDRAIPKNEKVNKLNEVAAERDRKIDAILSPAQVQTLKSFMQVRRTTNTVNQKNK